MHIPKLRAAAIVLAVVSLALAVRSLVCAAEPAEYRPLSFDGKQFTEGTVEGMPQLYVAQGLLPMTEGATQRPALLPPKAGAVAIYCQVAAGAGKRGSGPSSVPSPSFPVEITGKSVTIATRTDCSGFAILALPAGTYRITAGSTTRKIEIAAGKTATAVFTTGKRSY